MEELEMWKSHMIVISNHDVGLVEEEMKYYVC